MFFIPRASFVRLIIANCDPVHSGTAGIGKGLFFTRRAAARAIEVQVQRPLRQRLQQQLSRSRSFIFQQSPAPPSPTREPRKNPDRLASAWLPNRPNRSSLPRLSCHHSSSPQWGRYVFFFFKQPTQHVMGSRISGFCNHAISVAFNLGKRCCCSICTFKDYFTSLVWSAKR